MSLADIIPSSQLRDKLVGMGSVMTFHEGDVILQENVHIRSIPIVLKGSVRVMRTDEDGREILLYYIHSGESCIMSFLGGLHRDTSKVKAIAEDETEILFIPTDKVNQLIRENPDWLEYIFRLYHKRFEELLDVVNAVAFRKLDDRLLELIQKKSAIAGSPTLHVTHEQLANEIGSSRVVVSRLLKQMETAGLVHLGRNKISVV